MKRILIASIAVLGVATLAQAQGRDVSPHDPLTTNHSAAGIDRTQTASIQVPRASEPMVDWRSALPQDGR